MTFTTISAYIAARWGDITSPKRVPALDREVSAVIVAELFPSAVTDSQATETYTTKSGADLNYSISIHKSGNSCLVKGTITNNRTYAVAAQNVFTWKESAFKPKSGVNDFTFKANNNSSSAEVKLFLNNSVLSLNSTIEALNAYSFEFKAYIAQD